MKKTFFTILFVTLFSPALVFANTKESSWIYVFHLEYGQGGLSIVEKPKAAYNSVPVAYVESITVADADYYGVIVNVKGKEDARFGFDRPATQLAATKSPLSVKAPHYADADHVSFYNKEGRHLFDISVKGSSFCNDDNKCDTAVGEDHNNCPNDCAVPVNDPTPLPIPPQLAAATSSEEPAISEPPAQPQPAAQPTPSEGSFVKKSVGIIQGFTLSPVVIVVLVVSIIILLILIVVWKIRKNMD